MKNLAESGQDQSVQYRDGILCKVVRDYFAPVIPSDDLALVNVILRDLHASALGGHLARKKLLQ